MAHAWAVHEMCTTSNFATGNRWLTWYIGGLNYQVEHHLFPHVCRIHYPELQELVRQVAGRHGIPYNEHATLSAAVGSHFRMLRHFGSSGRQPAPADSPTCCPLCGNDNNCAMARGATGALGCWCYGVQIPVELVIKFQDTPPEDRRCICRECATAGREYR